MPLDYAHGYDMDAEAEKRISRAEWRIEEQEKRMQQGAQAFSDVRQSIAETKESVHSLAQAVKRVEELATPKPISPWKVAGSMFSVVIFIGSLIWAFARYPDRQEFERVQEKSERKQESIEADIDKIRAQQNEMRTEQLLIKDAVTRQEGTIKSIDQKIDVLVQKVR